MTSIEAGASPPTTDPVQEALSALVGATERLGRMAGEYLEAAQVAALRGAEVPLPIAEQMAEAGMAHARAVRNFGQASRNACPKASVPTWEWARLDELEPGDRIHHGVLLPAGAAWLVVVEVEPDAGAFDSRLVVRVNSEGGDPVASIVDAADVVVRRQVAAQRWTAADQQPIDLVPAVGDPWAAAPVVALHERETPEERAERMDAAYDAGAFGLADGIGGGR